MNNVSMSVTNANDKINKILTTYEKVLKDTDKVYKDISNINPDDDDYFNQIRDTIKDYKEDTDKTYKKMIVDHEIILSDLAIINKNKTEDIVIYNLSKFNTYCKKYKKLDEDIKEKIDDINVDVKYAFFEENYTLCGNLNKLTQELMKYDRMLEKEFERISKFANKK